MSLEAGEACAGAEVPHVQHAVLSSRHELQPRHVRVEPRQPGDRGRGGSHSHTALRKSGSCGGGGDPGGIEPV